MTPLVDINPGQWVLAFEQPYAPHDRTMAEHLELFTHGGGGWDHDLTREMFRIHKVTEVKPKTYWAERLHESGHVIQGHPRANIILAARFRREAEARRDKLIAIGINADLRIEKEMQRRIEKFARKQRHLALMKIHATLPNIFGRVE